MKCALCGRRFWRDVGCERVTPLAGYKRFCIDCAIKACEEKLARVEEEKRDTALEDIAAMDSAARAPCVVVNHPPIRDPYGISEPNREATGRMLTVENKPAARFGCFIDVSKSGVIYSICVELCRKNSGHLSREDCEFWREIK